jgi:hypothetical protein
MSNLPCGLAECHQVGGFRGSGSIVNQLDFSFGTFAPLFLASDKPMAIACLRLFTLPPLPALPERSEPRFRLRIALSTLFSAAFPYFLPSDRRDFVLFFAAILILPQLV